MGGIFSSPPPVVVQAPQQMATSGTTEVKPYAPVEPYIKSLLPQIESTFSAAPQLYTGSLVPTEAAQTLAARDIYGQVGQTASALAPAYQQMFLQDYARATGDITQDPIYQAQLGTLAQQARQMTEADKMVAQKQAMEAGQFGLGSTALRELQMMQQQKREQLAQEQMSKALLESEARRVAAMGRTPEIAQRMLQAQMTPATLQEAIGQQVEARQAAQLTDAARLAQQQQEAERAQLVTLANLFGGLAGLGSSTQMQQTSQGYTSSVLPGGPSPIMQLASVAGSAAPFFSDIDLKRDIKRVGKLPNGINVYKWSWTEEAKKIVGNQPEYGVIAQEVQEILPHAVKRGDHGYLMVNYAALGV